MRTDRRADRAPSGPVLRDATPRDLAGIVALLRANDLPTEDLTAAKLEGFVVVEVDRDLAGVVGLEAYGASALLRSLAVASAHRGQGLGRALVGRIEAVAAGRGVRTLYLLTLTADAFFRSGGYAPWDRGGVPRVIAETAEFAAICPDSAVCLARELS